MIGLADLDDRHLSEQYFTSFHTSDHFFRHVNSRPQMRQVLVGKLALLKRLGCLLLIGAALRIANLLVATQTGCWFPLVWLSLPAPVRNINHRGIVMVMK